MWWPLVRWVVVIEATLGNHETIINTKKKKKREQRRLYVSYMLVAEMNKDLDHCTTQKVFFYQYFLYTVYNINNSNTNNNNNNNNVCRLTSHSLTEYATDQCLSTGICISNMIYMILWIASNATTTERFTVFLQKHDSFNEQMFFLRCLMKASWIRIVAFLDYGSLTLSARVDWAIKENNPRSLSTLCNAPRFQDAWKRNTSRWNVPGSWDVFKSAVAQSKSR